MKRLKSPDLKMPDLQVPPFLADVYYDLRDRRLLPLVALVLVAIAAVPFLLGSSEEPVPPDSAAQSAAEAEEMEIVGAPNLVVVEAKPGLRDYRKRLRGRTPTDPFIQRYTGVPEAAQLRSADVSAVGGGGESSEVSAPAPEASPPEVVEPSPAPATGGGGSAGSSPGQSPGSTGGGPRSTADDGDGLQFFAYRPDVRFGVAGSGDLAEHNELPLASLLPKKNPVLIFIGVTENGKRAVFDVSPEVRMVRGPAKCVGGRQSCRLLFLGAGDAVDLVTEPPGPTFRLALVAIDFVKVDRSPSAGASRAGEHPTPGFSTVGQYESGR